VRFLLFFKLTFFLIIGGNHVFAKKLNDRILFTIGTQAYSQHEMEVYLQVKLALNNEKQPISFQKQYNQLFYIFLDDMIVHSQSTKIFDASFEEKQKNNILVAKKIANIKTYADKNLNSKLTQKKIVNILNIIQSIEAYKNTQNSNKSKASWLKNLKQKSDFRIFKDAKTYRPLSTLK